MSRVKRVPMVVQILIGITLGIVVGEVAGRRAEPLAQLGMVILDIIKGLAGPLLLFAILDAFLRTRVHVQSMGLMIAIAATNALIAIALGLSLSNWFQPGLGFFQGRPDAPVTAQVEFQKLTVQMRPDRSINFVRELVGYLPTTLFRPLVDNVIISIVILAVLGGLALRRVKNEQESRGERGYLVLEDGIGACYRAIEVLLGWVIALVPLAVFGVVAKTVGLYGFRSFRGVLPYVAIGLTGLLIQVLIVYQTWIVVVARLSLRRFWGGGKEALVTALGTGSSLATLPVTLRCLDQMGVSPQSARLAACVGTNLNNDGILLYEAMAVLFVAQAIGIELTLGQQALAAASCIIAGIGISGVPDAGLISLLIVLKTVKLPEEAVYTVVPFLLSVDWILGRCRAVTNVASDLLVAVLLDRFRSRNDDEAIREAESEPTGSLEKIDVARNKRVSDPDGI